MECESSTPDGLVPAMSIQCDWEDFIDVPHKQIWVLCKFRDQPSVHANIRCGSVTCDSEDFTATLGRNSLCLRYNPSNHLCRFIPAFKVFQKTHTKAVISVDAADGGLGVSSCSAGKLVVWDNIIGEVSRKKNNMCS